MALADLLGQVGLSLAAAVAAAWAFTKFLGERTIGLAFDQRLEEAKDALARETALATARIDDSLRRATELTLGEAAAEREYRFEARKRLYAAIGPLRFQLIQAALLLRDRIASHAEHPYAIRMDSYYGQSTLYRLGRVIGLAELIERQIAIHDFSVDTDMLRLIRFRAALFDALADSQVVGDHPKVDWTAQTAHLYRDSIQVIGTSMMTATDPVRIVRFDEFRAVLATASAGRRGKAEAPGYMFPLTAILPGLDPTATPVFWLRLLAVAALCDALVAGDPVAEALGAERFDLDALMDRSRDPDILKRKDDYRKRLLEQRARVAGATH